LETDDVKKHTPENIDVKKHTPENIVPVIDRDMFHNYVHVCKQLFLCDAIRSLADD